MTFFLRIGYWATDLPHFDDFHKEIPRWHLLRCNIVFKLELRANGFINVAFQWGVKPNGIRERQAGWRRHQCVLSQSPHMSAWSKPHLLLSTERERESVCGVCFQAALSQAEQSLKRTVAASLLPLSICFRSVLLHKSKTSGNYFIQEEEEELMKGYFG